MGKRVGSSKTSREKSASELASEIEAALRQSRILYEKCELKEAEQAFLGALELARKTRDHASVFEAIMGLLRLAGEALDEGKIKRWDSELDRAISQFPGQVPPIAWYCKGVISSRRGNFDSAQRNYHRFLRLARTEAPGKSRARKTATPLLSREEQVARAWLSLAITLFHRGKSKRAQLLGEELLRRFEKLSYRGINGNLYLLLGRIQEKARALDLALPWYQKAHATFLSEHNWYYHLYVLHAYGRLARQQQNYAQAYWYLDLVDKAASGPEFGALRREVKLERSKLEQDAVDLLVDSRKGMVRTREGGQISLRKQYILLNILEVLSEAHSETESDGGGGLSKAEIIRKVWRETYRPEAHDNKLYYNINRLRKLIEPDMKHPQYLSNWREGYRLAPGLKVHWVGLRNSFAALEEGGKQ